MRLQNFSLEQRPKGPRVVFLFPRWEVSGVTSVNLDLALALSRLGARCHLVVEEDNRADCPFDLPDSIPCTGLLGSLHWWRWIPSDTIAFRLRRMIARRRLREILGGCEPVALIPGYAHALVSTPVSLGDHVGIIGVVHADDETNVGFAVAHGKEWARCICVSEPVANCVRETAPWLAEKIQVIPNGVGCSATRPEKSARGNGTLRVVYAGRLEQKQKRIHDLPEIVEMATARKLDVQWEVAGEGPEGPALRRRLEPHIESGAVRWHGALGRSAVRELFREADIVILFSSFEGMPMCLLEAMAEGCVPVISTGCDAGGDLVKAHQAGFVVPTGDIEGFVAVLTRLADSPGLLDESGRRAWAAIAHGPHSAGAMGAAYDREIAAWTEEALSHRKD